jgi:hypothetical protein
MQGSEQIEIIALPRHAVQLEARRAEMERAIEGRARLKPRLMDRDITVAARQRVAPD